MVRLSDVCDVRDGTHDSPKYVEYGYPLVTSKNIKDGQIDLSVVNFITEEDYNKINERSKVNVGDIIMPMIGTIGNPYLVEGFCDFAIKNVALIKCDNIKVINRFVWYFLQSNTFERYIESKNKGGTQKFLSLGDIRNIELPEVSVDEQEDIIETLGNVDATIIKRKQQLQKLDELVKARFVEMFGDVINNPALPMVELKNIAYIGSSKRIYASEYSERGIPFYRSKEIRELGLGEKPSTELYITEERYVDIKKKFGIPKLGDILIAAIGATIGYSWVVDTEEPFYYKDGNIINISVKSEVNCVFLNYVLQVLIADYKTKGAAGSAQLALTIEKLEKMKVVYPEISLQNQFTDFVQQISKSKLSVQRSLEKLETLKKALMQKYFG